MTERTRAGSPFVYDGAFNRILSIQGLAPAAGPLTFIAPYGTTSEHQDTSFLYADNGDIVGIVHPDGSQAAFAEGPPPAGALHAVSDRPFLVDEQGHIAGIRCDSGRVLIFGDGAYSPLKIGGNALSLLELEESEDLLVTGLGHPVSFGDLAIAAGLGDTYVVSAGVSSRARLSDLQVYVDGQ